MCNTLPSQIQTSRSFAVLKFWSAAQCCLILNSFRFAKDKHAFTLEVFSERRTDDRCVLFVQSLGNMVPFLSRVFDLSLSRLQSCVRAGSDCGQLLLASFSYDTIE